MGDRASGLSAKLASGCVLLALAATPASARSGLEFDSPKAFETIPAATFDETQVRVGTAHLVVEQLGGGDVRMISESGIDGGARNIAVAVLEPTDHGKVRLRSQESRSFDREGKPLGVMFIDHASGEATCSKPADASGHVEVERLQLPDDDHVVNVPMHLLFEPLVRGEVSTVSFQLLLCRGGPRLMDFQARVVRRESGPDGHELVEVRYGPDLGMIVSLFARTMVPKLSFWFDATDGNQWLAHRIPLYSEGPEMFVVRRGVPTQWLAD
jgi:hypothetical protein